MPSRELAAGRLINLPDVDAENPPEALGTLAGELDLESVLVDGGDHTGLVAEGTITGSVLRQVDLSGARWGPLTLVDVLLGQVDLSNASWQRVVARRTELRTCRAIGLRLSVELATDLSIVDCRLDYATLHLEKVKGVAAFTGCSFREATISGDLSNVLFLDCDFTDTEFRVTRAAKCDLRTSRLTSARGLLSLRGATISPEQAVSISTLIAAEAGLIVLDVS
ncbi:MAG TPA: pentapeptide repeat-containing protein [Actinophytocola sp.]|uniref:pentapeptide repeat-containing protein n=1 Tax=Actinophytocola sp. TaxID=1872138 RepID=UPI002E0C97CB|nr:pentapeptide repeat-containing protein [Actinophytocola sp.]